MQHLACSTLQSLLQAVPVARCGKVAVSVSSQSEARGPGSRANEKPGQMTPAGDQFMFDTPTVHISLKCVKISFGHLVQ